MPGAGLEATSFMAVLVAGLDEASAEFALGGGLAEGCGESVLGAGLEETSLVAVLGEGLEEAESALGTELEEDPDVAVLGAGLDEASAELALEAELEENLSKSITIGTGLDEASSEFVLVGGLAEGSVESLCEPELSVACKGSMLGEEVARFCSSSLAETVGLGLDVSAELSGTCLESLVEFCVFPFVKGVNEILAESCAGGGLLEFAPASCSGVILTGGATNPVLLTIMDDSVP